MVTALLLCAGLSITRVHGVSAAESSEPGSGILRASVEADRDGEQSVDRHLLEKSREAGLLTDWHLEGRFGHKDGFVHVYAPEKEAARQGANDAQRKQYEMVFPAGRFELPPQMAGEPGVFYATSSTYLTTSGDWNVYLESGAEAVVFVDGLRVLTHTPGEVGVARKKMHLESGYHAVLVKFTAQAAPFEVAILPQNSGSRRKNNTPHVTAATSEDMMACVLRGVLSKESVRMTDS